MCVDPCFVMQDRVSFVVLQSTRCDRMDACLLYVLASPSWFVLFKK